jgi:hypothetical protein
VESMHGKKAKRVSDNDPVNTDMCRNIYSSFLAQKSIYSSVFRSKSIYSSQKVLKKVLKSIYSSPKNKKVCTLSTQDPLGHSVPKFHTLIRLFPVAVFSLSHQV